MNVSDLETTENDDDKIDAMGKLFFIIIFTVTVQGFQIDLQSKKTFFSNVFYSLDGYFY